jgi:hypothetical protein
MERILDLVPLIESGQLKMGGGISPGLLGSIRIERFHAAVEDWFRNKGRTFDAKNYNKYQKRMINGRARIAHGSSSTSFVVGMQNAHAVQSFQNQKRATTFPVSLRLVR